MKRVTSLRDVNCLGGTGGSAATKPVLSVASEV